MNKKESEQITEFEKELKIGVILSGSCYYTKKGKYLPYPAVAVMKEVMEELGINND